MDLIRALRLDQVASPPRVAFVGAGGKTTAMFQCARQFSDPVFVTATTHLAVDQISLADQHFFVDDSLLDCLEKEIPPGITLLTGLVDGDATRTLGLSAAQMERIYALAETHQIPLLIEADGSRQLPLKAPADHEPPIPGFVDHVVVVAGLQGLGKPLTADWVHRPEIFAKLAGLQLGEIITLQALIRVMTHPDGGLKNIPARARRIALLNQADTPESQAQATALIADLLSSYDSVVISSLTPASSSDNLQSSAITTHEPVAAVILAAGAAHRFGRPKQLLDWHGNPLIWHVAQKALRAGLSLVIVVCGREKDAIQRALSGLPVEFVHNPDWAQGQGTSVSAGTKAVLPKSGAILFLLADQPQIPVSLIRTLIEFHAQKLHPIIGPLVDGQRANPVIFDRVAFDDLCALSGEAGGRKLFGKYPVQWIPWHDSAPLLDVDTPEDYKRLLELEP
jgi:molybdenum cofactor cytidylyltransferase